MLRSIKFKSALTPVAKDLFNAGWANVRFQRDDGGRILGFSYGRKEDILARFKKVP